MEGLTIHLFKSSREAFVELLKAQGVEHRVRLPAQGAIMASGHTVEIIQAVGIAAGAILVPVAGVVKQYLKGKQGRQVTINLRDGGSIDARGLEQDELERVLTQASNLIAFDPQASAKPIEQGHGAVTDDDPGPG